MKLSILASFDRVQYCRFPWFFCFVSFPFRFKISDFQFDVSRFFYVFWSDSVPDLTSSYHFVKIFSDQCNMQFRIKLSNIKLFLLKSRKLRKRRKIWKFNHLLRNAISMFMIRSNLHNRTQTVAKQEKLEMTAELSVFFCPNQRNLQFCNNKKIAIFSKN